MNTPCLELVVFKIKDPANARKARRLAQDAVRHYEGFLSWSAYEGAEDGTLFADVVQWRDLPAAKAAAEAVLKDPQFTEMMKQIDGIVTLSHFNLDQTVAA